MTGDSEAMHHARRDIPSLTGLRFFAALTIVIGHFLSQSGYKILAIDWQFTKIGIPLFFAMSGFIIHYVYARLFEGKWKKGGG